MYIVPHYLHFNYLFNEDIIDLLIFLYVYKTHENYSFDGALVSKAVVTEPVAAVPEFAFVSIGVTLTS